MSRQTFSIGLQPTLDNRTVATVELVNPDGALHRVAAFVAADDFAALVEAVALIRRERAGNKQLVTLNVNVSKQTAAALDTRAPLAAAACAALNGLAPANTIVKVAAPSR